MGEEFKEGDGEFTFANADKYIGHFGAHVSGLAWRQGPGVYYTHEGQIYEGFWKDDKLDESQNVKITFQSKDGYEGRISKYKYNGSGTYCFKNNGRLSCTFQNNKPIGEVILIDHHDKLWYGVAEEEHVLLNREHVFSYELDSERGKGVPLKPPPMAAILEDVEPEEILEEIDMKELEKQVFGKSTKTPSEIDFKNSDWVTNYNNFTSVYKIIVDKVKRSGARHLSDEEKDWYKKFVHSARMLEDRKNKNLKRTDLYILRDYLMEMSRNTCPPTTVFYPTPIEEQEEQVEQ